MQLPLKILNPENDVPGKITAAGKAGGGEACLVLGPGPCCFALSAAGETRLWTGAGWAAPDGGAASDTAAAVQRIRQAAGAAGADSPETYKGRWSGTLLIEPDGTPKVLLVRAIASYAKIALESSPQGWRYGLKRAGRWFATEKAATGEWTTFGSALNDGLALALTLVRQACGERDTRRRGSRDPAFAAAHPTPARPAFQDPTPKFAAPPAAKKPRAPRKAAMRIALVMGGRSSSDTETIIRAENGTVALEGTGVRVWSFTGKNGPEALGIAVTPKGGQLVKLSRGKWRAVDGEGKMIKDGEVFPKPEPKARAAATPGTPAARPARAKPADAAPATTPAPRTRARSVTPPAPAAAGHEMPAVDPKKDQLLINAIGTSLRGALGLGAPPA